DERLDRRALTIEHPALPPLVSRPWIGCAVGAILGAWVGRSPGWGLVLATVPVLWMSARGRTVAALIVAITAVHSSIATAPLDPLPRGRLETEGTLAGDIVEGRYGPYALVDVGLGPILVNLPASANASRGDVVRIEGNVVGGAGELGGRRHRGTVEVDELEVVSGPGSPILALGNAMRDRVIDRLSPLEGGRGLLAGFMVGETSGVRDVDQSAMRRAGLSHFTAVSGSNVAIFLSLLYLAAGPIGIGPKRRAVLGLLGLPVFAAATRFEPSVLRASAMAGLILAGRLFGIAMETWQVMSAAVVALLLVEPSLVSNAGFQLSVAATAGVIVGARWPSSGGRVARALAVSIGAQVAVAPLLILHFGLVPLLSPLANLLAAPLVACSTVLGVLGVVGPAPLSDLGAALADIVLWLARSASGLPQMGWLGMGIVLAAGLIHLLQPRLRGVLALVAAVVVAFLVVAPARSLPEHGAVVLDVGQGDAVLIAGGPGNLALVDGGPDPVILMENLDEYGVNALDLVVLTHAHADHALGLTALAGRIPIGEVWAALRPHETVASTELLGLLAEAGIPIVEPSVGDEYRLGALTIAVEAPSRRYASANDQSIVLTVTGPESTMLLAGDIETYAQAELGHLTADVLKVPHHGAGTSDPDWLKQVGADLAVISVGSNDFGHPVGWVISTLEENGAAVLRTDLEGDVVVPLG
ncbi:MAG: ComEC/Rec2 family competence protein, partial [Acidimicrobiia bacterium]